MGFVIIPATMRKGLYVWLLFIVISIITWLTFGIDREKEWIVPLFNFTVPGWMICLISQEVLLVIFLFMIFIRATKQGFRPADIICREAIGRGEQPKTQSKHRLIDLEDTVLILIGIFLVSMAWVSFHVFFLLLIVILLSYIAIRHWLHTSLQADPLYAWKRLHLIALDRLLEIYFLITAWFFTISLGNQLFFTMTHETLQGSTITVTTLIEKYSQLWASPLPVIPTFPEHQIHNVDHGIRLIGFIWSPQLGFIVVSSLLLALTFVAVVRLLLLRKTWNLYLNEWFSQNETTELGVQPTTFIAKPDSDAIILKISVLLLYVYALLMSVWSIFIGIHIVWYLIAGSGLFIDSMIIPAAWTLISFASLGTIGQFTGYIVLSLLSAFLLIPPLFFLSYRVGCDPPPFYRPTAVRIFSLFPINSLGVKPPSEVCGLPSL